ncbi:hypothetical protein BGW38_003243, partial [Lunasporangiospora selenospora]
MMSLNNAKTEPQDEPIFKVGAPLAVIDGISFAGGQEWSNWFGNQKSQPERTYYPNTVEDLQAIVRHANEDNKKIRCVGSGHSWSPMAKTDDYLVTMNNLNKIHDPVKGRTVSGEEQWTVQVEMGVTVEELNQFLTKHDPPLSPITMVRVGGLLTMGTHGPILAGQSLSDQVTELVIVNGKGELVTYSEAKDPAAFSTAGVSLGALGIIYTAKLKLVPTPVVRTTDVFTSYDEVLRPEALKEFILGSEGFEILQHPFKPNCRELNPDIFYRRWEKTNERIETEEEIAAYFAKPLTVDHPFFTGVRPGVRHSTLTNSFHFVVSDGSSKFYDCSLAFKVNDDFSNASEAFKDLIRLNNEFSSAAPGRELTVVESRFSRASSKIMSQIYDEDPKAIYMQFNIMAADAVPGFYDFMIDSATYLTKKYNCLPHWGKTWEDIPEIYTTLRRGYGDRLKKFNKLRKEQDPNDLF